MVWYNGTIGERTHGPELYLLRLVAILPQSKPKKSKVMPLPTEASQLRVRDRVIEILSERIDSGFYATGQPLPAERTLAADFGMHRRAVREAVEHLVQVGLITHRPNCRPVVGPPPMVQAPELRMSRNKGLAAADSESTNHKTRPQISTSNLIALMMCHGGGLETERTSQERIFWGMNHSLMKLGYHAVFLDLGEQIGTDEENAAHEAEHLRYIRDQGFGGALFYPYAYRYNRDLVNEVSQTVPIVMLDRKIAGVDVDFVGCENRGAMFDVTQHLISQGHRRIVHVTRVELIDPVQDRVQGFLDAMRANDYPEMEEMVVNLPPYKDGRYFTVFDAIFKLPVEHRPTAAVCLNDYTAEGVAWRLGQLGLSVPGDVAVTGFDNIVPLVADGIGLTTVAQPYEEIGSAAVEVLMSRIKGQHTAPRSVSLPTRLIVRSSSIWPG